MSDPKLDESQGVEKKQIHLKELIGEFETLKDKRPQTPTIQKKIKSRTIFRFDGSRHATQLTSPTTETARLDLDSHFWLNKDDSKMHSASAKSRRNSNPRYIKAQ